MPEMAMKRRSVINTIADALEKEDFVPIETPIIEFEETLTGKYGEEEKLIYSFKDRGGRDLALRYDFTVPLARFIANNLGLVNPSFSRYQIGQVFRGEKPQKGRYREFTQMDFDIVGIDTPEADARIVAAAIRAVRKVGVKKAAMMINDRINFKGLPIEAVRIWDKYYKIGVDGVKKELKKLGENKDYFDKLNNLQKTDRYRKVADILETDYKLKENEDFVFDKTLARGLDYYTGLVFEMKPTTDPAELSIGAGGRYDDLIGMFAGRKIPAVGFSFGIDRLCEVV